MTGRERAALAALGGILAVTAAWWALALWPLPSDSPYWLVRTRLVCFGAMPDTLPTRAGWMLLIGEPLGMLAATLVIFTDALPGAVTGLARTWAGRVALTGAALVLFTGAALASARIRSASAHEGPAAEYVPPPPAGYPRLDRPAPPLGLVNQHGVRVALERRPGQLVLVTFAYAHCATVCPLLVREVLDAGRRLADLAPEVVVVTVDPWRDTPERLPSLAEQWRIGPGAHVLSGDTAQVLRVLDAWAVPHGRDLATGEIAHPNIVYLVRDARIVYAAIGQADAIVELARRL